MKNYIIILLLFVQSVCFGQTKDSNFSKFLDFATTANKLTDEIKKDCTWRYALVKVTCNKNNKIIKYQILNTAPASIKNFFQHLTGYKFEKNVPINSQPVIFCVAFENKGTECILKNKSIAAQGALEMYNLMARQIRENPKATFLGDIRAISYNYDPEREM